MNKLMSIFASEWVFIPAFTICVVVFFYMWADKIINFLRNRSLGQREEIIKLLDQMFVEIDRKKITTLLLLLSFGLGVLVFFILLPNVIAGLIVGAMFTVLGWTIPSLIVKQMWNNRSNLFVGQMIDGLTIMANGINSGLNVAQAMERVIENLKNPISQEFSLVLSQIRLGRSLEEALLELGERIPRPDVQMFVTAINILKETGGNLPETFTTIVLTIRERQKIEKKIEAMTAQGVMQGIIVTMVPFVLIGVFFFADPAYISPLFNTTLGLLILFAMLALQIIGGLAIRKIVKISV